MRFSIIPTFFLLCAPFFLAAQSAPAPTAPQIISEDDLKLGIYDAPAFQPAVPNATVWDSKLPFVLGPDTTAPPRIRYTPSYYRLQMACRQHAEQEDPLTFILEMLDEQKVTYEEVAHQE
jgi:hypothetical protein